MAQQKDQCSQQLSAEHSASQQPSDVSLVQSNAMEPEAGEADACLLAEVIAGDRNINRKIDAPAAGVPDEQRAFRHQKSCFALLRCLPPLNIEP